MKNTFKYQVYQVVKKIPKGRVLTYGAVAKICGRPCAARSVGNVLKTNYDASIPCHRVIRSNGEIGGYNKGRNLKIELLRDEGFFNKTAEFPAACGSDACR